MARKFENLPEGVHITFWQPGDGWTRYRASWQDGDYFAVKPVFTGSYDEVNAFLAGIRAERWRIWDNVWRDEISDTLAVAIGCLNASGNTSGADTLLKLLDLLMINDQDSE